MFPFNISPSLWNSARALAIPIESVASAVAMLYMRELPTGKTAAIVNGSTLFAGRLPARPLFSKADTRKKPKIVSGRIGARGGAEA